MQKPSEWIASSHITLQEGCHPVCTVIREWNEITPFVVHTAYYCDGKWNYERGDYCRTLEQAQKIFDKRA